MARFGSGNLITPTPAEVRDRAKPLLEWATPKQAEVLASLIETGSDRETAAALGISLALVQKHFSDARARAAAQGFSPEHGWKRTVPEGFTVKRKSDYRSRTVLDKETGEKWTESDWVISEPNKEAKLKALADAVSVIAEPFRGLSELSPLPADTMDDLLSVYPMGDPHLGMYAWAPEAGEDFDLDIAERDLVRAADKLVSLAEPSTEALIINLGDFFHSDSNANRTAKSGHALDVDGRWSKVLQTGIRVMRRIIDQAAAKHGRVTVINEIGNHDDQSSIMLSICLAQYYENNPRITIDTSPASFHWYRFGACLIGTHHGNLVKPAQLGGVMLVDRRADMSETTHRYWYTGHVHHDQVKEFPGYMFESFRTLAAADAWHSGMGYRSGRDMKVDTLHRTRGKIQRHIVGIADVR